jgi:DNA (cytosine-5)-methyltransferase 1
MNLYSNNSSLPRHIGKYKRRLTEIEAARLQSFKTNYKFTSSSQKTYKQLGNSVNVHIVREIFRVLKTR